MTVSTGLCRPELDAPDAWEPVRIDAYHQLDDSRLAGAIAAHDDRALAALPDTERVAIEGAPGVVQAAEEPTAVGKVPP